MLVKHEYTCRDTYSDSGADPSCMLLPNFNTTFVQVDTLSIHLPSNASVHLSYTVRICRTAKL